MTKRLRCDRLFHPQKPTPVGVESIRFSMLMVVAIRISGRNVCVKILQILYTQYMIEYLARIYEVRTTISTISRTSHVPFTSTRQTGYRQVKQKDDKHFDRKIFFVQLAE